MRAGGLGPQAPCSTLTAYQRAAGGARGVSASVGLAALTARRSRFLFDCHLERFTLEPGG